MALLFGPWPPGPWHFLLWEVGGKCRWVMTCASPGAQGPFQMHSQPWSSMLLDLFVASHPHDLTRVPTTSATNSKLKHD